MTEYTRYRSGEWSALYEDGNLVVVGDHYLTDEYLEDVLKVTTVHNEDFLTEDRHGALPTLREVETFTELRESRLEEARKLREHAQLLIQTAERLEGTNG